jgi:hypothetical protein
MMSGRASKNVILPAQLDDLPDEVILKLFAFLSLKELLLCGQVTLRPFETILFRGIPMMI